jgi:hypothetical protein
MAVMDIAAATATAAADEAKMLLQCGKQIADLAILGKGAGHRHQQQDEAGMNNKLRQQMMQTTIEEKKDDANNNDTDDSGDWLDEEMKSIQWPDDNNANSISSWKQAANSFFASSSSTTEKATITEDVLQSCINHQSKSIEPFLISIRRLLHRYPELMYQERMTSQIVQRVLTDMGITNFSVGWAKNIHSKYNNHDTGKVVVTKEGGDEKNDGGGHGIVVDIGSGQEPCVLLRADMDALPIVEQTPPPPDVVATTADGKKFHSKHHGKMHACGHVSNLLCASCLEFCNSEKSCMLNP